MIMTKVLMIGILTMFNFSCAAKEIVPDTSRWNSYCSEVVNHLICYKLPGSFKEIIAPKRHVMLNDKSDFADIFLVGYDYRKDSYDLPKFEISMQVYELENKMKKLNFHEFSRVLAKHYNYITMNSTNPSNLMPGNFEYIVRNNNQFAVIKNKNSEGYDLMIDYKYFIAIGATYGMYSNVSSKWKVAREKIFNEIISSITITSVEINKDRHSLMNNLGQASSKK